MTEYIDIIIYAAFILSGLALIAAVILFFTLNIPGVIRDMRGSLEKRHIEEIRSKNTTAAQRSSAVNVFEEMQQKASQTGRGFSRRSRTGATTSTGGFGATTGSPTTGSPTTDSPIPVTGSPIVDAPAAPAGYDPAPAPAVVEPLEAPISAPDEDEGTVVLKQSSSEASSGFVIIKKLVFVSNQDILE